MTDPIPDETPEVAPKLSELASELFTQSDEEHLVMVGMLSSDPGALVTEDALTEILDWARRVKFNETMLDAIMSGRVGVQVNDRGELTFRPYDVAGECLKRTGLPWSDYCPSWQESEGPHD